MSPFRTILHPTDFSECSRYAFRVADTLAREQGAHLVVLHVQQPLRKLAAYDDALTPMQPGDSANGLWKSLCRFGVPDNKVRVEHRLEEGEPSKEILRVAAEVGCDLIVMGTHGRTGLERLVLGSVAERVLAKARCPVLTLKTPSVPSLEPCYDPGRCLHAGGRHSTEHNPMISG